MKTVIKLSEEIIPLSRKQAFFLFIIISCFFQFALFYTPALAEDAVYKVNNIEISNDDFISHKNSNNLKKDYVANENKQIPDVNLETISYIKKDNNTDIANNLFKEEVNDFLNKKISFVVEEPKAPEIVVVRTSTHVMTAYNSEVGQTDSTPCITANGFNVCQHGIEDTIAANFLPFGTKVRIPDLFGDRIFIVRDRMNKRFSERVDVWMLSKTDALKFGVKKAKIEVVEIIEPEEVKKEDKILLSLS